MKRILLIICAFGLSISCDDSEKAVSDLTVNPSIIEFDSVASTKRIYISSNTSWSSSSSESWCTSNVLEKFGDDTVNITVSKNTGDERIAYVSFSNSEKTVIKTVKVIQKSGNLNFSGKLHSEPVNPVVSDTRSIVAGKDVTGSVLLLTAGFSNPVYPDIPDTPVAESTGK
jgi:hypothetical protein